MMEDSITHSWITVAIALAIGFILGHKIGVRRTAKKFVAGLDELERQHHAAIDARDADLRERDKVIGALTGENHRHRQLTQSLRAELDRIRATEPIRPNPERRQ